MDYLKKYRIWKGRMPRLRTDFPCSFCEGMNQPTLELSNDVHICLNHILVGVEMLQKYSKRLLEQTIRERNTRGF